MRARSVMGIAMAASSALALTASGMGASAQEVAAVTQPAPAAPAPGSISEAVVAIVNDDIISSYDLMQRMRLILVTSGVQPTEETMPQLQREALRSLVDERLQLQEIRRVEKEQGIEIVPTDAEVDEEIAEIAKGNNMTGQQLVAALASQGVGAETLRSQLRSEVSWQRWIQGRYGSRLRIGADQVKAARERLELAASKPQYQVGEIFIDNSVVGGAEPAMQGATQLVEQLQKGAPFPAVARQFSTAPTAAAGGDAGWISTGEMPPEVDYALENMRPGQLSRPIPVKDGVYIVYLREKRTGATATLISLKQAAVPLGAEASETELAAARAKLESLRPRVTGCDNIETAAAGLQGVMAGDLGEAEIQDLAPAFREAAETLQPGQLSAPIRTPAGLHLVAVCGKRQSGAQIPSAEQIENRLMNQQLAMVSKRYLRDLRNSATIETR
ncbi:MAG TPA: peptidylprolyl isomerase [Caulobacteraceae bacterium]|nr:peptidylprolyl isomerase [Caulobacteraceae bacterium]